jgi:hypothetical protein
MQTRRVRQYLAQVLVIGFFKLILNNDLVVTISAKNVQFEIAHPVFGRYKDEFAQA